MRKFYALLMAFSIVMVLSIGSLYAQADPCSSSNILDAGPTAGDNTGASDFGLGGSCFSDASADPDLWYNFVAPAGGVVNLNYTNNTADNQVVVFESDDNTCTGIFTEIQCWDIGPIDQNLTVIAGNTYFVMVDAWDGTPGSYTINIATPPPPAGNTTCDSATVVTAGTLVSAGGPDADAGASATPCTGGLAGVNAVWYVYTPVSDGTATVTSDFTGAPDTRVQVHTTATDCSGLTCIGGDDDGGVVAGLASVFTWNVCAGQTYYIEWDDRWSTDGFDFIINESCGAPAVATLTETTDGFTGATWAAGGAECSGTYTWGVYTDGDIPGFNTPLQTGTGSYPVAPLDVTGLTDATNYDLYVFDDCGGSSSNFTLTEFQTLPLCPDVSNLSANASSATTVDVSWDPAAGAVNYNWEIQDFGDPQGTMPAIASGSGAATSAVATGAFVDGNTYTLFVQSDCPPTGGFISIDFLFQTPPPAPVGVSCVTGGPITIFTEDFDNNAAGWTGDLNAGNGSWLLPGTSTSGGTGPTVAFSSGNYMHWEASFPADTETTPSSAVSPSIDLTGGLDDAELTFYMHAFGTNLGTLDVVINDITNTTTTTEYSWTGEFQTAAGDPWVPIGVNLSAYLGSVITVEFVYTHAGTGFEGDMSIDAMSVVTCANCTAPAATAVDSLDCTSGNYFVNVDLTSLGSATDVDIEVNGSVASDDVSALMVYTYGPFTPGTPTTIDVIHNGDNTCDVSLGSFNTSGICNDNSVDADPINCGDVVVGSNVGATIGPDEGTTCGTTQTVGGVWYVFAGTGDNVTMDLCNGSTGFDSKLSVFEGAPGSLTCVGGNDDACGLQSSVGFTSTLGTNYYVLVHGFGTNQGTFELTVTCTPPGNPIVGGLECDSATVIMPGVTYSSNGPNAGGGASLAPCTGGLVATNAVWYSYTATTNGSATVTSDFAATIDTRVQVYDATAGCAGLVCVGGDDDGGVVSGFASVFTWPICAGTTYYIEWDDRWDPSGFDFIVTETAGCTDPAAPFNVLSINTDGFTDLSWTPGGGICGGGFEWEIIPAPSATGPATGEDVQTGTGSYPALLSTTGLMPATDYEFWVRDDCGGGSFSNWVLATFTTASLPPANDEPCTSENIVVDFGTGIGDNSAASASAGVPIGTCFTDGSIDNDVWFDFVAPAGGEVDVNYLQLTGDNQMVIFSSDDNTCTGILTELVCDDGAPVDATTTLTGLTPGDTYYIQVDGWNGFAGTFEISISTPVPSNGFVWNGGAGNGTWTDGANWDGGTAPSSGCSDTVYISNAGTPPTIDAVYTVGEFSTQINTTINTTGAGALVICGNADIAGGFNQTGPGTVVLDATGGSGNTVNVTGTADFVNFGAATPYSLNGGAINISNILGIGGTTLTNASTDVTLLSTAAGTAVLDDFTVGGSAYVGDVTVQRFVTAGSGLGQRYFGSAVNGGVVTGLDATYAAGPFGQVIPDACSPTQVAVGSPYSNLFEWHEDAVVSCDQEGFFAISEATALTNGRGYSGWMNDGSTLEVTGAPNTGAQAYGPLTNTPSVPSATGWHILANPYPSPVAMASVAASGLTSPQYYDASTGPFSGTFQPIAPASNIPVMQGFVAQVGVGSTWSVTNADRVLSNEAAWFSGAGWFTHKLDVVVTGNGFGDITSVYYSDNNTTGFDAYGDCVKRSSNEGQPTLYTKLDQERMSLNGFAMNDLGNSIPLGMTPGADGSFTFSFDGLNSFPANTTIYLEDKLTGEFHNIAEGDYKFSSTTNDNRYRFELHFVNPVQFDVTAVNCDGAMGAITLTEQDKLNREYAMFHNGSMLVQGAINNLNLDLASGNYTVELYDQYGGVQTYDVAIEAATPINTAFTVSSIDVEVNEMVELVNITQGATSFEWIIEGQTINNVTDLSYSFDTPGSYEVMLSATNGECTKVSNVVIHVSDKSTSINNVGDNQLIEVYANLNTVYVDFENVVDKNAQIDVYNMLGQSVATKVVETTNGVQKVVVPIVTDGYYIVKVTIANGNTSTKVLLTNE